MNYEIIASLGPGSSSEEVWEGMLEAGATGFRLNTSHIQVGEIVEWIERVQRFLRSKKISVPLTLDLQGSKWRVGQFPAGEIRVGQRFELVQAASTEESGVLPVPHPDFFRAAVLGGEIVSNDAKVRMVIEEVCLERVVAQVILAGELTPNKGITLGAADERVESLNLKDQAILEQTRRFDFIRYAISYIKNGEEMSRYREIFGRAAYLIAKMERGPALEAAEQIAETANELWVCRGDLGAELGFRGMAEAVHRFSEKVRDFRVPVILAGQVLEHMTASPTPTRSEVYTLYDALTRGYRGFVLSDEAAVGRYPVESCRMAAMFMGD